MIQELMFFFIMASATAVGYFTFKSKRTIVNVQYFQNRPYDPRDDKEEKTQEWYVMSDGLFTWSIWAMLDRAEAWGIIEYPKNWGRQACRKMFMTVGHRVLIDAAKGQTPSKKYNRRMPTAPVVERGGDNVVNIHQPDDNPPPRV